MGPAPSPDAHGDVWQPLAVGSALRNHTRMLCVYLLTSMAFHNMDKEHDYVKQNTPNAHNLHHKVKA